MRICVQLSTGKVIEMQSGATAGTLIKNAIGAGFAAGDIEEREVTPAEYEALFPPPPAPPDPSDIQNLPKMIKAAVLGAAQMSGKTPAQA